MCNLLNEEFWGTQVYGWFDLDAEVFYDILDCPVRYWSTDPCLQRLDDWTFHPGDVVLIHHDVLRYSVPRQQPECEFEHCRYLGSAGFDLQFAFVSNMAIEFKFDIDVLRTWMVSVHRPEGRFPRLVSGSYRNRQSQGSEHATSPYG